jgi:hypothetical protein
MSFAEKWMETEIIILIQAWLKKPNICNVLLTYGNLGLK